MKKRLLSLILTLVLAAAAFPFAAGSEVYTLYRAGIIAGSDEYGTFNPDSRIRRSEVAAILVRILDASKRVNAPAKLGQKQ